MHSTASLDKISGGTRDKYTRDISTGALLCVDHSGLAAYKKGKARSLQMDKMCDDINSLKEELFDIKNALKIIIHKFEP